MTQLPNPDPQRQSTVADPLLAPSIPQPTVAPREKPWRVGSQVWIAFFGGVLPAAVIAYQNGARLRLAPEQLQRIVMIGFVGLLATVLLDYALIEWFNTPLQQQDTMTRLASRAVGLAAYVAFRAMQKSADRVYQLTHGDDYSSLWARGFLLVISLGLVQNLLVFGIVTLLRSNL